MSSPSYAIRPVSADEFDRFSRVPQHAFNGEFADEESNAFERSVLEFDRTLAVLDVDQIVATTAVFSFEMTVPGGTVPAAGVSWVSVLPSHRRRGILSALMRRQLDDIRDAAREPVAILWASEPQIYGRYGYGLASTEISLVVPRTANELRPVPGTDGLVVRFVETEDSVELALPLYDHDRARRPGMLARTGPWERTPLFMPSARGSGSSPLWTAVVEGPDGARGYTRYVTKRAWADGLPHGSIEIRELHASDPAAAWVLWRHLTDLDLSGETVIRQRPSDEPLLSLLINPRAAKPRWGDGLYLRLMDVGAALSQRTYAAPVDVVLDVDDAFCPWNTGRWHLVGDATGGRCEKTDAAAQICLSVRELGSAYLGGTSLLALKDAGLVEERSPGAVAELSLAMRHEPAPWSSFVF